MVQHYLNLGQALNAANGYPEAVGYLQAVSLTLEDDSGDALNLALTRLLLGDYSTGGSYMSAGSKQDSMTPIPGFLN